MSNSLTNTVASSCICTSPLAVMTVVGLHDFVKVSISAEFKSFLLIICIDAPKSTTISLSSGLRFDAGRHTFGQLPRCFAGTLLLPLCLFLRPILKFWSVGAALMRFTWANISERRILVSNLSVTRNSFREFHTLDWFLHV